MELVKVYFDSEKECRDANAAKAVAMHCDMTTTVYWWEMGEDEKGWYLVMTVEERDAQSLT